MAAFFDDDTPLPPEVKKRGKLLRIAQVIDDGFARLSITRFHGVVQVEKSFFVFSCAAVDALADLALAKAGDDLIIGATNFDGAQLSPRSVQIQFKEESEGFPIEMDKPLTSQGTVLRKATYLVRDGSYLHTQCRVAVFLLGSNGRVVTFDSRENAAMFACEPGDQVNVDFTISKHAPHRASAKTFTLTRLGGLRDANSVQVA